jgi:hypothetical protein
VEYIEYLAFRDSFAGQVACIIIMSQCLQSRTLGVDSPMKIREPSGNLSHLASDVYRFSSAWNCSQSCFVDEPW